MSRSYQKYLAVGLACTIAALLGLLWSVGSGPKDALFGSAVIGNEYNATSTRNFDGTALTNLTVLKSGGNACYSGSLAQVTITGANTGIVRFWNATTTNVNLRTGNVSSSTIHLVDIPASAAANTYTFDLAFGCGLIYELVGGLAPTSTITWR